MGKIFEIQFIIFAMFKADKQSAAIHKFQLVDTLLLIQIHYFQFNWKCLIDQNTTLFSIQISIFLSEGRNEGPLDLDLLKPAFCWSRPWFGFH